MSMNLFRAGLSLVIAAGISSCGGEAGEALTEDKAAFILGNMKTSVLDKLPGTASATAAPTLPMANATTAGTVKPMAATDCETVTPAVLVDADADGIALEKNSSFSCTNTVNGGYSYTREGTYKVVDLDDTVDYVYGGMRVDYNITKYNYVSQTDGSTSTNTYSGFWLYENENGTLVSTSEFNGHHTATYPNYSSITIDYDYTYTWNYSLTPTTPGVATAWQGGTVEFDGTYRFNGSFMNEIDGAHRQGSGVFQLRYYTSDLVYRNGCTKFYDSGSIFFDDGNGNSFEIRYACATAKLYVNGVESDLWAP